MPPYNHSITMVDQPRRVAALHRPSRPCRTIHRYLSGSETALLLGVSEAVLTWWRGQGHGPQPVVQSGRLYYEAASIERLAAMPTMRRMMAIGRFRR